MINHSTTHEIVWFRATNGICKRSLFHFSDMCLFNIRTDWIVECVCVRYNIIISISYWCSKRRSQFNCIIFRQIRTNSEKFSPSSTPPKYRRYLRNGWSHTKHVYGVGKATNCYTTFIHCLSEYAIFVIAGPCISSHFVPFQRLIFGLGSLFHISVRHSKKSSNLAHWDLFACLNWRFEDIA